MEPTKKLTENDFKMLMGRPAYSKAIKDISKKITDHARKLTAQKLISIKVTDAGINLESNELYMNVQGQWKGNGALNYTIRWPMKFGSSQIKFLEDVGNIPD